MDTRAKITHSSEKYYATNLKAQQVIVSISNTSANRNSNRWNSIGILRLVLKTPHIVKLYRHYYDTGDIRDFCEAFGIPISSQELILIRDVDTVIDLVENNPEFVKQKRIDPVYEAVTLPYPSYIFALAMGTGKTVLIGTIIATEFAMALRYPEGEFHEKCPRLCARHNDY